MATVKRPDPSFCLFFLCFCLVPLAASSGVKTPNNDYNHVIVQLEAEPLAHRFGPDLADELLQRRHARSEREARDGDNDPDDESLVHETQRYSRLLVTRNEHARRHVAQMEDERTTFLAHLGLALGLAVPGDQPQRRAQEAKERYVARLYDHEGQEHEAIFSITLHGLALHVPDQFKHEPDQFIDLLKRLPHVRNVARGRRMVPQLYNAGDVINLSSAYEVPAIGNLSMAGKGIKIASLDDGVYSAAPMFDSTGFEYPAGWTDAMKGDASNCNGKVILSKAFSLLNASFPANPGPTEDTHGTFSSSIACGVATEVTGRGNFSQTIHGIAPQAWIMSYRFHKLDVDIIKGLEAIVDDGADVIINSWAAPAYIYADGQFDAVDHALINAARAGLFVTMAASNEGPDLATVAHSSEEYITVGASTKASYLNADNEIVDSTPYMVADTSSRGPSVLHTLKPDITAPGVQILAQGYGPDPEARNMGFGVASGTSFATPMVAGAAALMKQVWPAWTPKQIKAAFMASAKWKDMTSQHTGLAAQPLDMGAGNLNIAGAMDPGALLDPPSLSFSFLAKGLQKTIQVSVWSAANTTQVYDVASVFTGPGSADDYSTPVSGITFTPAQITLAPGETAWINVTFDSSSDGVTDGDNQGFIVLTSKNYEVHMPLWARVLRPTNSSVLILNALGSSDNATAILYLHTWALNELGFSSVVQDVLTTNWTVEADLVWLSTFPVAFLLTGNNGIGYVETIPFANLDLLRQWTVMGGKLFASGVLIPSLTNSSNRDIRLVNYLANFDEQKQRVCVEEDQAYTSVQSTPQAPDAFQQLSVPLRDTYSRCCLFEIDAIEQPESGTSDGDMVPLYPREVLPLLKAGNITVVMGKRAQPSQKRPGLRFPWATVTSVLGLDMLPQDSRVPFIAAVLGYLMEDVSLDITVAQVPSSSKAGLLWYGVSFNSSVPEAIRAQFPEADKLAPTYVIHYGDGHTDTFAGTANVNQEIVSPDTHCYASAGSYNVTVEAVSPFGTGAVRQHTVSATEACSGTGSLRAPLAFVLAWLAF